MTIKPCSRCPLKRDCGKRLGVLRQVKGLRLTSVKFRCEILAERLKAGMWVNATFTHVYDAGTGYEGHGTLRAVVVRIRPDGRVVVWVPDDPYRALKSIKTKGENVNWISAWPDTLKPIEGMDNEPHCHRCGSPDIADSKNASCRLCNPRDGSGW